MSKKTSTTKPTAAKNARKATNGKAKVAKKSAVKATKTRTPAKKKTKVVKAVAAPIFANGPTKSQVAERLGGITDKVIKAQGLADENTGRPIKGAEYRFGKGKKAEVITSHKQAAIRFDTQAFIDGLTAWAKGKGFGKAAQVRAILTAGGIS